MSNLSSVVSIGIGPLLLYPVDRSIFEALGSCGKSIGMIGAVSVMNAVMLIELFIFISMIFKIFSGWIQKRRINWDVLEGRNHCDSMKRLFISFFTMLTFAGTAALLSSFGLDTSSVLACAFLASIVVLSLYYIPHYYKETYKKRPPFILALRHELGFASVLWICIISVALASITATHFKNFGLTIGLTIVCLFLALLGADKLNAHCDQLEGKLEESRQKKAGIG